MPFINPRPDAAAKRTTPERREIEECLRRARAHRSFIAANALDPPRPQKSASASGDISHHPGSPTLIALDDLPPLTLEVDDLDETP